MNSLTTCRHRRGFTLVEVLVAATLTVGLFAGLWTLFGIFASLQSRSESHAARAQITRGVIHQVQDDLNRIVIPPRRRSKNQQMTTSRRIDVVELEEARGDTSQPPNANDQTDSVDSPEVDQGDSVGEAFNENVSFDAGGIALRGSANWMIMDLSLPGYEVAPQRNESAATDSLVTANEALPSRTSNDRQRVVYFFVSPETALLAGSLPAGLTRWEIPTSTSLEDVVQELNEAKFGTPSSRLWGQLALGSETSSSSAPSLVAEDGSPSNDLNEQFDFPREDVPEIERFLIRYAGESGWTKTWNSREQGLPTAIECLVVWRDRRPLRDQQPSASGVDPAATNSNATTSTNNLMKRSNQNIAEELDKARLLADWERLGSEDFAVSGQPLPPGFSRYVFCLPSAPITHRSSLELLDSFSSGATR